MASEQDFQDAKQWADALLALSEQRAIKILELEQQLAEAREENERLIAKIERLQALGQKIDWEKHAALDDNIQALVLLEKLTRDKRAGLYTLDVDDYGLEDHTACVYCRSGLVKDHEDDCPIEQARAFLAPKGE